MPAGVMKGHARTAPASPVRDPLRRAIARFERERARKREQQDEASSPTATAAAASSSSSASASNSFTAASEPMPLLHKSIAEQEEQRGIIELHVCWNDLSPEQDRQKVRWLFDTQQLFSVQLPKMPREYVTRLVFDRNHRHLLVNKHGKGIIAGICYRPFPEQGFAEIVFCAVTADEQVKGYGTLMMNHLKDYMVGQQRIFHLLTYADEFAIGYFAKQDFVTQIALPEECYKGFIKEYQGATLMYCQLHPKMIYVRAKQIYQDAKQLYMMALRERFPNFGREFEGLEPLFKLNEGRPLRAEQIPGLETLHNFAKLRAQDLHPQVDAQQAMRTVLQKGDRRKEKAQK